VAGARSRPAPVDGLTVEPPAGQCHPDLLRPARRPAFTRSTAWFLFFFLGQRTTAAVIGPVGGVDGPARGRSRGAAGCGWRVGTGGGRGRPAVDGAGVGASCPPAAPELSTGRGPSVHRSDSVHPQSCPQMWVKQWSLVDTARPDRGAPGGRGGRPDSQESLPPQHGPRSVTPPNTDRSHGSSIGARRVRADRRTVDPGTQPGVACPSTGTRRFSAVEAAGPGVIIGWVQERPHLAVFAPNRRSPASGRPVGAANLQA
jgi:hypothetical protein